MYNSSTRRRLMVVFLFLTGGVALQAQSLPNLFHFNEPEVVQNLRAFDLGDVDGDGLADFGIIADTGISINAPARYRAAVLSGGDGHVIYDIHPWSFQFGIYEFVKTDDLDGDGLAEVAYTTPFLFATHLNIVYSTNPGQVSSVNVGNTGNSQRVSSIGDVTGDGISDWAISSVGIILPQTSVSMIEILDGASLVRTTLWSLPNTSLSPGGLVGIGDVDGDGVPDVAASSGETSFLSPFGGSASVFSGQTGAELRTWYGQSGDRFGSAMVGVGDLDGDGAREVAILELLSDVASPNAGRVRVFSTGTGVALMDFLPGPGEEIRGIREAGDHDGDGVQDLTLIILDTATLLPRAELRSSATGALIQTLTDAAPVGDLNGDGISDVLRFQANQPAAGQTRLTAFTLLGAAEYGVSPGAPDFQWEPGALIPAQGTLALTGAQPLVSVIGIVSFAPANTVVPGTTLPLFVSANPADVYGTFPSSTDVMGEHRDPVNLAQPGLTGLRVYIQYGVLGAIPVTTNAVEILFGP